MIRLTALFIVLLAATGALQAQGPGCQEVVFSAQVLSRFPGAPAACLDVISRDGVQYAVFKAQLQDVRGETVRVRVKKPDGTQSASMSIATKPGRKVLIEGKPYPVSELAPNQEITAYVRVDRPMIALAPVPESGPLDAVPLESAESDPVHFASAAASMPETATSLNVLVLLGGLCIAIAMCLTALRLRRK